jgi:PncC family amidohydrolase
MKKVNEVFRERGVSLSAAESCTGGLISHYLTSLPGSSEYFLAGIVSYSVDVKKGILGIPQETIRRNGVISSEIACAMAEKIRELTGSDFSVASTGNIGPSVLEGKDKGLVYIAAAGPARVLSKELRLSGDRDENKEEAAVEALRLLIELVE